MEASLKTQNRGTALRILDGALSAGIVLYAANLLDHISDDKWPLAVLFLLLAAQNALRLAEGRYQTVRRVCSVCLYAVSAALILAADTFILSLIAAACVEFVSILLNRVLAILKKPKRRVILFNAVCILIVLVIGLIVLFSGVVLSQTIGMDEAALESNAEYSQIADSLESLEESVPEYVGETLNLLLYVPLLLVILLRMILHVVGISMSQMKLNILMNIIRETYVLEILLGLLLMIIACSAAFTTLEADMAGFGDALWYSFALVTTIGFGDIAASTLLGRVLSVFLGIYGIVVVAIITSVIVNFYGEMRRISGTKAEQDADEETDLADAESDLPDADE